MNNLPDFPPGLILILGALLVPFLKGSLKNLYVIALPAVAFYYIIRLPETASLAWSLFPGEPVQWLRVDKLSKAFGYIFTLNAVAAFIYAFYVKQSTQHVAALIYIGAALGTVFSGDLISAYVNWEVMAIASTVVILCRNTNKARGAAMRYFLIHAIGGLSFLAGLVMVIGETGGFAFDGFDRHVQSPGMWLILLGFLVNAAAPPLHAWLSDAYPEATVTGGVILSAYTTKTAVYALLRGFEGWPILIWVGCAMTIYGIIYALLENDMRRILAYSIINQVGFMVCGAGIGTEEAINGVTAHAFCHIIYKSLLWMSAGAVLYRVGKSKCTELGGLYKSMPWTMIWGTIGALAISAVPLTSGFTSKTIIIAAAEHEHLFWPWLILEVASAGVFLHAGIKFPYFVFFNKDRGLRPKEAPFSMHLGMIILAALCIFLGLPWKELGLGKNPLYQILPYPIDYDAYTTPHVIMQMQLLMFAGLIFFLVLPLLKRTDTISLDTDWFWRKGGQAFYWVMDKSLNGINQAAARGMNRLIAWLHRTIDAAPMLLATLFAGPWWRAHGVSREELEHRFARLEGQHRAGVWPIGLAATLAILLLAALFFL